MGESGFHDTGTQHMVFRLSHFNTAIFLADNLQNYLNSNCAFFFFFWWKKWDRAPRFWAHRRNSAWGSRKNILPLKSYRNKIIHILFQQCYYIHDLLIWTNFIEKFLWGIFCLFWVLLIFAKIEMTQNKNRLFGRYFETVQFFFWNMFMIYGVEIIYKFRWEMVF